MDREAVLTRFIGGISGEEAAALRRILNETSPPSAAAESSRPPC